MTDWSKKMRYTRGWAITAITVFVLCSGCAEKGPILLNIGYQPAEEGKVIAAKNVVVGVSPFKDTRGSAVSLLGTRTIPSGMQNDLVVQGTVSDVVTTALKTALKEHGLKVEDVPSWDLSAEGMKAEGADLLFGGEIRTMQLESKATSLKTKLTTSVQIKIVVGDIAAKKIIRTLDVQSKIEQEILYSRDKLQSALSEALTSALDQIFQDDVLSKSLQAR
jgi:hypothetical protein